MYTESDVNVNSIGMLNSNQVSRTPPDGTFVCKWGEII